MNQNFHKAEYPFTKFRTDEKGTDLRSYDIYDRIPPITYAKGTLRHLVISEGRQVVEDPFGFGFIITSV